VGRWGGIALERLIVGKEGVGDGEMGVVGVELLLGMDMATDTDMIFTTLIFFVFCL
jgi:hypothetical protein